MLPVVEGRQLIISPTPRNTSCRRCFQPTRSIKPCRKLRLTATAFMRSFASEAMRPVPGVPAGVTVCSAVFLLGIKILLRGLTPAGVANSWILGTMIYAAFGWAGFLIVCLYFLLGTAATKLRQDQKEAEGIAEKRHGRRSIGSVWGSGFAGTICAFAALMTQHHNLWQIGFVASFVSKLSDTVSSEVGKGYGKTTYLSTTLKRVPRGTEGAVSLEGTLAGILAAAGLTAVAWAVKLVTLEQARLVVLAAFLANWAESFFGALTQGRPSFQWISNDLVNILQISLAAALAMTFIDF